MWTEKQAHQNSVENDPVANIMTCVGDIFRCALDETSPLDQEKSKIISLARQYKDRLDRSRRIYVQERPAALANFRDLEYSIRSEVAQYFAISLGSIYFCGSAQLGFSVHKNRLFSPGISDLDIACVSGPLFQSAWKDAAEVTRAFSDPTKFSGRPEETAELFKDQLVKRGLIRVSTMPRSETSSEWQRFEAYLSRKHAAHFGRISFAIYINEYAFCWKQDSVISALLTG